MPRRPAKVTQADIARAIRAAKEPGAHEVTVYGDGVINSKEFDDECDAAIISQIALSGDATDHINAQKQRNEPRGALLSEPPKSSTLRWYWTLYKQSDHWLGDLNVRLDRSKDARALHRAGE